MRGRLKDGSLKNLSALVPSEDNIAGEDSKDVCDLHTDLSVKRLWCTMSWPVSLTDRADGLLLPF